MESKDPSSPNGGIMLTHRKFIPLDYSLCRDVVTVYRREGLTRHVLEGVFYEDTQRRAVEVGREAREEGFLLIVPGGWDIRPGDRLAFGLGPEITTWAQTTGLATVESVKQCRFQGQICHTEARG